MINLFFLIIVHNKNPADRIFNLWAHKYIEQIRACHIHEKEQICGLCFFNLFYHDFNKSTGGLIKSNGSLLDEINVALNKKNRNQSESFAALLLQKIPSIDAISLCFDTRKCNSNIDWRSDFFAAAAVQAGWGIAKCGMKITEATTAGFQDCPSETKSYRGCCFLLWVELLLLSRQEGVFWRTNNATLKAIAMPITPCSTIINRETAGTKPRPSQYTATESHGEANAVMLWAVKK